MQTLDFSGIGEIKRPVRIFSVRLADEGPGSSQFRQRAGSPHVIDMTVGVDQIFDIVRRETELPNVVDQQIQGVLVSGIK